MSENHPLKDTVSQGGILSLTLFVVVMNGVIGALRDGVPGSLYVSWCVDGIS